MTKAEQSVFPSLLLFIVIDLAAAAAADHALLDKHHNVSHAFLYLWWRLAHTQTPTNRRRTYRREGKKRKPTHTDTKKE